MLARLEVSFHSERLDKSNPTNICIVKGRRDACADLLMKMDAVDAALVRNEIFELLLDIRAIWHTISLLSDSLSLSLSLSLLLLKAHSKYEPLFSASPCLAGIYLLRPI